MALIGPRVHGNALRTGINTHLCVLWNTGVDGVSGIANKSYLVEVNAQRRFTCH
jgi:hypothetical protein